MSDPTPGPARRRPRFAPRLEGLEGRVVLSSVSPAALAAHVRAQAAQGDGPAAYPLRMTRFTGLFQGSYTVGPSRAEGYSTQLYMTGGGNTSSFLHGDVQLAFHTAADVDRTSVGRANLIPKGASDSGDQLLLDFESIPGAVDKGGRPNKFNWTVSSSSGGQFGDGVGSGTLQLFYFPSKRLPRGAVAAGRLGVAFRGTIGVDDIGGLIW